MARTAPQLPNNAETPAFSVVNSTTGFNQGDYVYYNNGLYNVVQNGLLTSGTFPITATVPAYTQSSTTGVSGILNYNNGGSLFPQSAAVLTNGNIVSVFSATSSTNYVSFRIDTPAGVSVVAPTAISTTTPYENAIGVIALTGGGFVAFYSNNSRSQVGYAVFTNGGSVTTAETFDSSFGTLYSNGAVIQATALANGGFVLAAANTSNQIRYRIYNATGTALYTATTIPQTCGSGNISIGLAARSDSSFCIAFADSSATSINYYLYSATNTLITNSSFTSSLNASGYGPVSVGVLTNDTFVIAYPNYGNNYGYFRLLPTGNTLGSELATNAVSAGGPFQAPSILGLSSGGFIYGITNSYSVIEWCFFNSSGTAVSPATNYSLPTSFISNQIPYYNSLTLIEASGVIYGYFPFGSPAQGQFAYGQSTFQISESTYNVIPYGGGQTVTVANATAPVYNYAKSASSPNSASFYAQNTQTLTASSSAISGTQTPTVISSSSCNSVTNCALQNGAGFAVAYNNASSTVTVAFYNASGVRTNSVSLGSGSGYSSYWGLLRMTTLTNGNVVVGSIVNGSTVNLWVISPSGSIIAGPTAQAGGYFPPSSGDNNYAFSLAPLPSNKFVIVYTGSGYPYYSVYDGTTLTTTGGSNLNGSGSTPVCVSCGSTVNTDGFWASWYDPGYGQYRATYWKHNSGASYSNVYITSYGSTTNNTWHYLPVTPSNNLVAPYSTGGGNNYLQSIVLNSLTSSTVTISNPYATMSQLCGHAGMDSTGLLFGITLGINIGASTNASYFGVYNYGLYGYTSSAFKGITTNSYPQPCVSGLFGNTCVLTWLDANNYPNFLIFNTVSATYSKTITAGVTVSASTYPLNITTGYTLAGVATTSAAANGNGTIQTNGAAVLNSGYNSSQPYLTFDATTQNYPYGVKGSVTGLKVNLLGS